ncbi:hypothetical protein AGLY_012620 [Aphis glycines]|uniref:Uncharacterized protein n=1 Tax=Aphis glycines TaxID=307491 RepID=A0A6G0TB18_APHGL|nr:hypothetical protein AGLY_012620 [Aphis glycines]
MARYDDPLNNAIGALSIDDDRWIKLGLDHKIRTQLSEIENNYESIFSWDIQKLTGVNLCRKLNLIDKIRDKQEMIITMDDEFDLNRFYLQLVASYELYNSRSYRESYLEIQGAVKYLKKCKFDKSIVQYFYAYHHITQATNAYVALTLKIDSEKLLNDVKHVKYFNQYDKAAICAVKAKIFMEYPPEGNDMALKFVNQARYLDSIEPEWIVIWLKAKGRVRRYYKKYTTPDDDEIDAANMLCTTQSKLHILVPTIKVFEEAGFIKKITHNQNESIHFYKLASDITKKAIELAKDDTNKLIFVLLSSYSSYDKSIMSNLIAKLTNVQNRRVDQFLGFYYLKHEKDYVKAKIHFTRGMDAGDLNSSLQLIKTECLLKSVNDFPYVQSLNTMYDNFPTPSERLIILTHILMYYNFRENNPREMMRYLKMYIDQEIDDTVKLRYLTLTWPLFKINMYFGLNTFLDILSENVKKIINNDWSLEEKQIINNTFDRFNKILKLNINDIKINVANKTTAHEKRESWRKQRVDLSEDKSNKSHQHQSNSKYFYRNTTLEKHVDLAKKPSTN